MRDKNKTSNFKKLKDLHEQEKFAHKQQIQDKVNEISKDPIGTQTRYMDAKKLKWYDYLIVLILSFALIGLSFILGIFALKSIEKTEWIITAFALISLLAFLITNWIKNRKVANYYNDITRRYQTTLSEDEGFIRRLSKIILLICLVLSITSIILAITLWV
ncbi:hypothetical protein [Spiroplasma cantharicola]|uniref:Transmembrane protein n=1 Tax=Spiroplasma cantharicola TaxID=362837 RepID=A0A0M5KEG2_9MOLU|nr:hypothetical protein [Spiroplasma cantharicola]ALD66681.1 hypothetical protein SCANT_v1c07750 [Spiroplasma cantharicola]